MELYNTNNNIASHIYKPFLSVKAKVWSNYFITVRRVSLTCKFLCVYCLAVCLFSSYSSAQVLAFNQFNDLYWWRIA
ncbi:hypothetical protein T12_9346 [Trichinella patagoniensis]|uniref:Uncharacterized protein n=1 Tax=Trichinella patagoniensis TaxID=990121 RepID=A0A0V0ZX62_9BILA|nr:hypothetical protein T12_9346 [Trichinella patagoniensis]